MCGILVAFSPRGDLTTAARGLAGGLSQLRHRGPDNTSSFSDDRVFLGHTRLSIIDTAASANQPFRFGEFLIVFNGEVFNYIELREELVASGYEFTTSSDTEVVLKAFHCWGESSFDRFNGMWSLAIYNEKTFELVVSRDRFGQKPLFAAYHHGTFMFASEIQALLPLMPDASPNFAAITSFLKEGDFDVGDATFFEEVFQFPVASAVSISPEGRPTTRRYWHYPSADQCRKKADVHKFHELLADAVRLRLRTDVGYSILLSGGIDSTIVAALTREISGPGKEIAAFTYASHGRNDEEAFARQAADMLEIDLAVSHVVDNPHQYVERLRRLVYHMGRGHSSPAIVSSDHLYENVRRHGYKVALDGQGADELLAGYKHYHFHLLYDLVKSGEWRETAFVVRDLFREGALGVAIMALRSSLPPAARKWLRRAYGYERLFADVRAQNSRSPFSAPKNPERSCSKLNAYLKRQHVVGLSNLLYYGDITAMVNSVENRSPFMDHRLVEMGFMTQHELKVSEGRSKSALRLHPLYARFASILERPKVGFDSPIGRETKEAMVQGLRTSRILDWPIWQKSALVAFLESTAPLQSKYERFLFRLYQTHLWSELFGTGSLAAGRQEAASAA